MNPRLHQATTESFAAAVASYGQLPEWNLADLYEDMHAPPLKADLLRADSESVAFEGRYRGKLAEMAVADDAGRQLAEAVSAFEALEELLGRIISYAGLLHAGDT